MKKTSKLLYINFMPILVISLCISATSCKGPVAKKVGTEAVEMLEKKGGSLEHNAGRLEREATIVEGNSGDVENTTDDIIDGYKKYRKAKRLQEKIDNILGDDDGEPTPQATTITCPTCQGNGAVYATDAYGNVIFDYNGNPQIVYCPQCGGNRIVVVYQ